MVNLLNNVLGASLESRYPEIFVLCVSLVIKAKIDPFWKADDCSIIINSTEKSIPLKEKEGLIQRLYKNSKN